MAIRVCIPGLAQLVDTYGAFPILTELGMICESKWAELRADASQRREDVAYWETMARVCQCAVNLIEGEKNAETRDFK